MTLSKTTEYALQALSLMAQDPGKMYSSDFLHRELKIPKKYLQRLLTGLTRSKLLTSIRGKYGGFVFARDIKKIKLSEIIEAVEGFETVPTCFFGFGKCALNEPCAMHTAWEKSQKDMIKILSATRLSDVIKK